MQIWNPTPKIICRTKVKQKLVESRMPPWSRFIKSKYCIANSYIIQYSDKLLPPHNKNNSHSSRKTGGSAPVNNVVWHLFISGEAARSRHARCCFSSCCCWGDLFWFPMCSFSEVCSKVARFVNIISKTKQHFAKVCSRFAGFYKPTPK